MKAWKDVTQYSTAVASLVSGIVLTFCQYFETGDISNGVLGYVGQTLLYASAIFGVTMYWNGKYREQSRKWDDRYNELKSAIENGKFDNMADSSSEDSI